MPQEEEDLSEFLDLFLSESQDRFESLNRQLVELEDNPHHPEILQILLRDFHSLKGSAGMFGFNNVKETAHRLEDLMMALHASPDSVNANMMDILFRGCDILRDLFDHSTTTEGVTEMPAEAAALLENIDAAIRNIDAAEEDLAALLADHRAAVDEILPLIEDAIDTSHLRETLLKLTVEVGSDTVAGVAGQLASGEPLFLGAMDIHEQLAAIHPLLAADREEFPTAKEVEAFFATMTEILDAAEAVGDDKLTIIVVDARESVEIFSAMELDFDTMQIEYYRALLEDMAPFFCVTPPVVAGAFEPTKEAPAGTAEKSTGGAGIVNLARKTVRVEEAKIDAFLDSVGEMIILGEVYSNLEKRLGADADERARVMREFRALNANFGKHVFTLQKSLMEIRRVELRNITGSLLRLVRDTSRQLGKEVVLEVEGEKAVLDKSLLDDINTCLVHVVRNALDHGIESPEARQQSGKSKQGHIRITALNEDNYLLLRVNDDGCGIDTKKLLKSAIGKGSVTRERAEEMNENEILRLIFANGLSTSEEISDISGRGVGMSAVLETVERIGGSVDVRTKAGQGTEIALRAPLSVMLSVIDGLVVTIDGNGYIIPIRHITESFLPTAEQIITVQGQGECVRLRESLFPLIRIRELFHSEDSYMSARDNDHGVAILVTTRDGAACLYVDDVQDHQQVVIKDIEGIGRLRGILGGALMGDGRIGLVLDVEALLAEHL